MLEINVSCPNVSAGGRSVGTDPVALANLMDRLRPMTDKPMIVKLTPNVTDITVPARAAVESGADALSMINTLLGMRIKGRVWASRPGHFANTEFMKQLRRTIRKTIEDPVSDALVDGRLDGREVTLELADHDGRAVLEI